jgi:DNA (cytosine-5)-methyltransferase 1
MSRQQFNSIELFAGAGGMFLGFENVGFKNILCVEFDKNAVQTLKLNRPKLNVICDDIRNINFAKLDCINEINHIDLLSGGIPCQSFSYSGQKHGLNDTKGSMFYEFCRAIKELSKIKNNNKSTHKPKIILIENVKGMLTHDNGKTFKIICRELAALGYDIKYEILNANDYNVAQKRQRLIIIGVDKKYSSDANLQFNYPKPNDYKPVLRDAFKNLKEYNKYSEDEFVKYPKNKYEIMKRIPQGGSWVDLPLKLQKSYLGKSYDTEGGKRGIARRLSMSEPSLTLTTSPMQKQTERCHPSETRPLSVHEYAAIQSFPSDWVFCGSKMAKYRQIGNAVPVNLAEAVGHELIKLLKKIRKYDA